VSAGEDHEVRIWDCSTGNEKLALKSRADRVRCAAFSPDGRFLASISEDGTVKVWDSATGNELYFVKEQEGQGGTVLFSPDSLLLATGNGGGIVSIRDSRTGKKMFTLRGNARAINSLAFSPDSRRLAVPAGQHNVHNNSGTSVTIWDTITGKELLNIRGGALRGGYQIAIGKLSFSPDGRRLAAQGEGGGILLWDTRISSKAHDGHAASIQTLKIRLCSFVTEYARRGLLPRRQRS
jgi:hypothetical protein